MIDLYTWPTPNGLKPIIALEELGLDHTVHKINIMEGDQDAPEFRAINPNGKIPAIVDTANNDLTIFESGAILIYLAEKTGQLMPADENGRFTVLQWLMFQMGGIGPMMGQSNFFTTFYKEDVPVGMERYQGEVNRLFAVMDGHLAASPYLAGEYSIADIATWPWIRAHPLAGVEIEPFANLKRWYDAIEARDAVQATLEKFPGRDMKAFAAEMKAKRAEAAADAA